MNTHTIEFLSHAFAALMFFWVVLFGFKGLLSERLERRGHKNAEERRQEMERLRQAKVLNI